MCICCPDARKTAPQGVIAQIPGDTVNTFMGEEWLVFSTGSTNSRYDSRCVSKNSAAQPPNRSPSIQTCTPSEASTQATRVTPGCNRTRVPRPHYRALAEQMRRTMHPKARCNGVLFSSHRSFSSRVPRFSPWDLGSSPVPFCVRAPSWRWPQNNNVPQFPGREQATAYWPVDPTTGRDGKVNQGTSGRGPDQATA